MNSSSQKEKKKKTCTGFELSTLAPNSSTTQPPVELMDCFLQYLTLHVLYDSLEQENDVIKEIS